MKNLFYKKTTFNGNISKWNTSNVINMISMFANAKHFNQPIENWDVSNIINMRSVFYKATSFNILRIMNGMAGLAYST